MSVMVCMSAKYDEQIKIDTPPLHLLFYDVMEAFRRSAKAMKVSWSWLCQLRMCQGWRGKSV